MSELTQRQTEILKHTLGADSRYLKKQWGFRNHYYGDEGHKDYKILLGLVESGLMASSKAFDGVNTYFRATKEGALAIGFKPAQLKKAGLK